MSLEDAFQDRIFSFLIASIVSTLDSSPMEKIPDKSLPFPSLPLKQFTLDADIQCYKLQILSI